MRPVSISVAYMPLVDAAPLIIAQELGFAQAEGIALDLIAAPSWSSVRDMLAFGRVDAAHMLSAIPVAMSMGLGGVRADVSAVSVMSVNGNAIGVGRTLEAKLRATGYEFDFADPVRAAAALAEVADGPVTIGVPFPFSMHVELLRYWAERTALGRDGLHIRTVPPPLMADALAEGEVDAFCVGEPWGSVAVENRAGALLLPGKSIWQFAPEKVLAVRTDWADTEPALLGRLMRAVWRAGRWLSNPAARATAADLISRKAYLDVSAELVDRALSGHLIVSERGETRQVDHFVEFHQGAANFPWRSQEKWLRQRLMRGHEAADGRVIPDAHVFRSDLFRRHLAGLGGDLPAGSEKVEGTIDVETSIPSAAGQMTLLPNRFFDGQVFDPVP